MPTDDEDDAFFGYFNARNCLNERILFGFFWEIVFDCLGIYKGSFSNLFWDGIAFVYLASR